VTNSIAGRIFDAIMSFINLFRFWIVLNAFEEGIILRLGKMYKKVGPGLHWRLPLNIDELHWVNVRRQTTDSWEMCITSEDGKTVTLSFDMVMEVYDVEKVILTVHEWQKVAYTTAKITLAQIVEGKQFDNIMCSSLTKEVKDTINLILRPMGIHIVNIGITDKAETRAFRLFTGPTS